MNRLLPKPAHLVLWLSLAALTAPPAVSAETSIAIRGTVLRADGSGLMGAEVELAPLPTAFETEAALLAGREPGAPVATAISDAVGHFTLVAPGPGVWQLRALADDHVPMRYPLLPLANGVVLPPVTLRPAVRTTISVLDGDGVPISGAGILAASADGSIWAQPEGHGWKAALRVGWTDATGQLHLPRARGERFDVWAHLGGHTAFASAKAVRDVSLVLRPTAAMAAQLAIREPGGSPAADVIAFFADTSWPLGRSDENGQLRLHGDLTTPVFLRLSSADGRTLSLDLEPGAVPGAITLPPPDSLTGQVRDGGGAALAGALVWAGHDPGRFTRTDASGRYVLPAGVAEEIRVQAHAAGFVARGRAFKSAAFGGEIVLVLPPALTLRGRVVDAAGGGVADAQLMAVVQGARPAMIRLDGAEARGETDSEGRFVLAGLTPGVYSLTTNGAGFGTAAHAIELPNDGQQEALEIVLAAGRLVVGRVVDLEERPLEGIVVRLRATAGGEEEEEEDAYTATSDADGIFKLHGLPGETLDVLARGRAVAPLAVRGVQVAPGSGPVDLGTLVLAPGASLAGRVVDPSGAVVAAAEVWIIDTPEQAARWRREGVEGEAGAVADAQGRFLAEGLEPGREVGLYVDGPGFLPTVAWGLTPPLAAPLEVTLLPAAQVHGEVVDEAGTPIAGAEISMHGAPPDDAAAAAKVAEADGRFYAATSDEEGRFTVEDVAVGAFQIEAYAAGFVPAPLQDLVIAEPREVAGPRFVLARGAVLTGQVMDANLEPVAGARVRLGRPQGESDEEGRYQVAGIPPGRQAVEVFHPGFNRLYEALDIEPGGATVDFVLEGGHRVAGYVVDGSSLPVSEVVVILEPADDDGVGETYEAHSDAEGAFSFAQVAEGGYRLQPHREGYAQAGPAEVVQVVGGPLEGLEVRVARGARIEGQILGLEFEQLAQVEVRAEAEGRRLLGEVDYEGGYEISDLGVDDWTVIAYLPGGRRQARARVSIESGDGVVSRDLEFGNGFTLEGLVRYGGEPLTQARVQLRGHDVPVKRVVTTDLDGRFAVQDLAAGAYRISLVHSEERLFHNEDLALTEDREVVIDIDTAHLAGIVVDAVSGEPVADALVVLHQQLTGGETGSQITVPSNGDGRFSASRLSAGRYHLRALHDGYQPAEQEVEVAAGSAVEGLRVSLEPAAGLEVAVALAAGPPPQYITLWGHDGQGRTFAETRPTYAEGLTVFPTLPAGDWNLLVGAAGGATVESRVAVPGEPLAVVLPPAGRLRVRVPALVESDSVGTLVVQAQDGQPFRYLAWGGELQQSWPVNAGRATVEGLPAGFWQLQVQGPGGEVYSGVAATTGGPDIEVELQ